jgi:hypothetical protein
MTMRISQMRARPQMEFPLYDDESHGVYITLRHIPMPELTEYKRKCRPPGSQFEDEIDFSKWIAVLADKAIVGWRGFVDDAGNEAEFTRTQALAMMRENNKFATWITTRVTESEQFLGNGDGSDGSDSLTTQS